MVSPALHVSPSLVTRTRTSRSELAPAEGLLREAAAECDRLGLVVTPSRLRRLVRRYVDTYADGSDLAAFLLLTYPDPTGERAVRRVMRSRRHG